MTLQELGWTLSINNPDSFYFQFEKDDEDEVGTIKRFIIIHDGAIKLYTDCMIGTVEGWLELDELDALNIFIKQQQALPKTPIEQFHKDMHLYDQEAA